MAIAHVGLFAEQAPDGRERTRRQRVMDWLGKAPVRSTIRPTYVVAEGEWAPSEAKLTPDEVGKVIDQVLAMDEGVYDQAMTELGNPTAAGAALVSRPPTER